MPTIGDINIGSGDGQLTASPNDTGTGGTTTTTTTSTATTSQITVRGDNLGIGSGVYAGTNGTTDIVLNFKTVVGGAGIYVDDDGQTLTLSTLAAAPNLGDLAGVVAVDHGGTGKTSFGVDSILLGNGVAQVQELVPPSSLKMLTHTGTGYDWANIPSLTPGVTSVGISAASPKVSVTGTTITSSGVFSIDVEESALSLNNLSGILDVTKGGTGRTTHVANALVIGNGTGPLATLPIPSVANAALKWDGVGYTWEVPSYGVTSVSGVGSNGISVTGSPITSTGTLTIGLTPTGITSGTYSLPNVTVDAFGRVTAIASTSVEGANLGAIGVPVFSDRTGNTLNFRQIAGDSTITTAFTSNTVSLSVGLVPVEKGGTGLTFIGSPYQVLSVNPTGDGLVYTDLGETYVLPVAGPETLGGVRIGDGLAITHSGILSTTGGDGTVTSVAVASGDGKLSVTGGPITTSGTIIVEVNEPNLDISVMAGELPIFRGGTGQTSVGAVGDVLVTSSAVDTTWRALTASDVSGLSAVATTGSYDDLTDTPTTSGTVTSVTVMPASTKIVMTGSPITSSGTYTVDVDEAELNIENMIGVAGVSQGGTGMSTVGSAGQFLRVNSGANALVYGNIAATDVSGLATVATSGAYADLTGVPTITDGTVTSVGLTAGSTKVSVTGSTIVDAGAFVVDIVETEFNLNNQQGVLTPAKGGTGVSVLGTPGQILAVDAAGTAYEFVDQSGGSYSLPIASAGSLGGVRIGSGLAIDGAGVLSSTASGGTVTSVGMTAGSNKIVVSGSPITTSGDITVDVDETKINVGNTTGSISTARVTGLATVSTTGSYNDLIDKPTIGTGTVTSVGLTAGSSKVSVSGSPVTSSGNITVDVVESNINIANTSGTISTARVTGLTTVATTGAYSDLTGTPTIPTQYTDAMARSSISATGSISYNSTSGVISYTAPILATVATTGAYSDLTGLPTLTSGTVTSVGLTAGSSKVSVSGSPVTSSGSITVDVNEANLDIANMTGTLLPAHGGTGITSLAGQSGKVVAVNATNDGYELITAGGSYTLPTASSTVLGGVKVGTGLAIDGSGVLSSTTSGGTVTSVGLNAGSSKVSVSGSPVTSSGSITVDVNEANLNLNNLGGTLSVTKGGTGLSSFTTDGLLIGAGSAIGQVAAPTTTGHVLTWNGTSVGWAAAPGAGGGESNTASNAGSGTGLFYQKTGTDLEFKSLAAGTNVTLNDDGNGTVTVNASSGVSIPTNSTAGGTYMFSMIQNPGNTTTNGTTPAAVGLTGLPAGWSVVVAGGITTITHNIGRPPVDIVFYVGAGSTSNPTWKPVPWGSGAANANGSLLATGSTAINTTSFAFQLVSSMGCIANGTTYVVVAF